MNNIYFESRKYASKFIEFLLDYNQDVTNDEYFEIHIYQEELGIIIEFELVPHSGEWGGHYRYVEEDEEVFKEVFMPDNSSEWVPKYRPNDEVLKEWLINHPGWEQGEYGHWYYKGE